ncbi:RTA-like protein [Akanthomyces lecanii RCEF 1005]|uniref:RTA-like protein n=1 Tax=Akanthomyces lecanii RCEF 1005 TaxID=1081108 RepID=A0A167YI90_CORDF|nr:RTA-like protein [Akanthomyces lecanii RCEF 1005]
MDCKALTTEGTQWHFCPSMSASIVFTILFAGVTLLHIVQAIFHRTWYSWVIVVSGALQVATYVFRDLSIREPDSEIYYVLWFVLILVASVWTNAYVYMVFGRMVWRYQPNRTVLKLKAWHYGTSFVLLDMLAFIVQVGGAVMAARPGAKMEDVMRGLHTYMVGVGIQETFILCFCVIVFAFLRDLRRQRGKVDVSSPILLVWVLLAALFFITVRIVFRLVEYSSGLDSSIPNNESWQYGLDSLPMLIALLLLNLFHPGRIMPADETKIPSFFERRRLKRHGVDLEKNPYYEHAL